MSFVANDDLCCPICDLIYPTANSAFVLSCSDEGPLSHILSMECPRYVSRFYAWRFELQLRSERV